MFEFLRTVFITHWGTYFYGIMFFASSLILLILEKDKTKRNVFLWYPIIVFILLFTPISIYIANKLWGGSVAYYCRLFSIIPIFIMIAYAIVLLLKRFRSFIKLALVLSAVIIISFFGKNFYKADSISRADNWNKIPEDVISLCDNLHQDGEVITIAVPETLVPYIRQYDASIQMPYGRQTKTELITVVSAYSLTRDDCIRLIKETAKQGCDYVVLHKGTEQIMWSLGVNIIFASNNYYVCEVNNL